MPPEIYGGREVLRNIALLAMLAQVIAAAASADNVPDQWVGYNRLSLADPSSGFERRVTSVTPQDMLIEFWKKASGDRADATLPLTSNRYLAVRNISNSEDRPVLPLNRALVDYLMIPQLLERAIPDGPRAVKDTTVVDVSEDTTPLEVRIPGDIVTLPVPWRLRGRVRPDAQGRMTFELTLSTAEDQSRSLAGYLELSPDLSSDIADSLPLSGWSVFRIDRVQLVHLGNEKSEYWPRKLSNVATLGELRAHARPRK
jgi:hypothetical protein